MTDIVVMGAGGMLGRALMRVAKAKGVDVMGLTHDDCCITSPESLQHWGESLQSVICINAAGIVPDAFELALHDAHADMLEVNGYGPKLLNYWFDRVVQVSIDCVFDGTSQPSYDEDSPPTPRDYYGLTKLAGELPAPDLTIRTSFVGFGPRGFLRRMVLDQPEGATITGYANWLWSGMYVDYTAELILQAAVNQHMTGLYHLGGNVISKAELLQRVCAAIRPDIKVEVTSETPPRRMVLESVRWRPAVPTWDEQIERMANDYRLYSNGAL